jgi:hypothetical protein
MPEWPAALGLKCTGWLAEPIASSKLQPFSSLVGSVNRRNGLRKHIDLGSDCLGIK